MRNEKLYSQRAQLFSENKQYAQKLSHRKWECYNTNPLESNEQILEREQNFHY